MQRYVLYAVNNNGLSGEKKKKVLLVCCPIPFWPAIAQLLVLRLIISQVALTLKYFTGIVGDSQFQVQLACQ